MKIWTKKFAAARVNVLRLSVLNSVGSYQMAISQRLEIEEWFRRIIQDGNIPTEIMYLSTMKGILYICKPV
jgi:hypothetical protein